MWSLLSLKVYVYPKMKIQAFTTRPPVPTESCHITFLELCSKNGTACICPNNLSSRVLVLKLVLKNSGMEA